MGRIHLLLAIVVAPAAFAGPAEAAGPAIPAAAAACVSEAWERNLALQGRMLEVEVARARLAEAQSAYQPRLDLVARYSAADGGRTIDFPAGDLLNGVYRTLNDTLRSQGQPAAFPQLSNQSIALLRGREQETKLRLVQPIFRPEIAAGVRGGRAVAAIREAQLAAYRRELRLAVLTAYYAYLQTEAVGEILASAAELTAEAVRVNRLLAAADKLTEDRVLRAEADDLAVQQQRAEALRDRNAARGFVNLLRQRPPETPVERAPAAELQAVAETLLDRPRPGRSTPDRREELVALQEAVKAAAAGEEAVRGRSKPTVALAVEGGIQGEDYRTGGEAKYVQGSVLAQVNLWDGRERHSQLRQAQLERRKAELQLAELRQQLVLQMQQAGDDLDAAAAACRTAVRRTAAVARAFDLVAQREREGLVNQLTFVDARNELTRAELNREITRYRLLMASAAYERAAATEPLP